MLMPNRLLQGCKPGCPCSYLGSIVPLVDTWPVKWSFYYMDIGGQMTLSFTHFKENMGLSMKLS